MNADQIHHRSGGMTLVCSSCNTQNSIPLMHPNWLTKESTSTFCQSCERVTLQRNPRFKGSNASGILLKHSDSDRASKALSGRSRATSNNPSFTNPLADVVNQSVYLSNTSIPQGIQNNVPGAPIMEASDKSSAQITKLNVPEPHCTVHPNQVGEYWCCLDRVIVCPRCHVHGIHKDHPFINLVDAAQRHTAGLLSWCTRAREQLQQTSKVKATLLYASEMVQKAKEEQNAAIHETFERLHQELNERRTQLLQELESQTSTKLDSFDRAIEDICKLIDHHEENLLQVEPLIQYTPLVQHDSDLESDKDTFHWATKIMAVVQRIQFSMTDPIPLPNVSVPLILCSLSDISFLQGIRLETVPTGLRLPEYVDTNSFNFSFSGGVPSRTIFRFKPPSSSDPSLLLLNEGMTLSREPSPSHFHKLILGSQVFYNGVVAWYVHIDRIGPGLGHILCGIMEYGSEGEGVVWDGIRIVGPNAHEERTIVDGGTWKAGDVLGFLLELDTNTPHLTCSYNYDHIVSRVLLPTRNSGWCPAFSIHCSLDQITIIPAGERSHLSVKKLDNNSCNREVSKQTENKALIRSLQEQLASISQRFMMEQQKQMERDELLTHMTMSMARNPVRNLDENEANKYTAGNMKHVEIPAPKTSPLKSAVRPAFRKESENNEMHDKKSSTVPVHSKNDQLHSKSKNEGIEFGNEINSENIVSDELKMLMDFVSNLDK